MSNDLSCRDVVELLSDYLEDALPADERERVEQHLEVCEGCRRALEQLRLTVRLTGMLSEDALTPDTRAALLTSFRDWRTAPGAGADDPA